jgi:hypothetical protein
MSEHISPFATSSEASSSFAGSSTANDSERRNLGRRAMWRLQLMQDSRHTVRREGPSEPDTASGQITPIAPSPLRAARGSNRRPGTRQGLGHFHVEARYEGTVLAIQGGTIIAHLQPSDMSQDFLSVEIPINDVAPHDRRHVTPGSVFYWISGYEEVPNWRRTSILTFAGYKRSSDAEVQSRQRQLMTFLEDDEVSE